MKFVAGRHTRLFPGSRKLAGRSGVILLAVLLASCGSGGDAPQQPSPLLEDDATLSSLSISGATLDPAFSASISDYTASVPNSTDTVEIVVTPNDDNANAATMRFS